MIAMMIMITTVEDHPGEEATAAMVTGATEVVVAVINIKIGINHKTTTETTIEETRINSIKTLKTMLKAT